jgi:hypothetical protein
MERNWRICGDAAEIERGYHRGAPLSSAITESAVLLAPLTSRPMGIPVRANC